MKSLKCISCILFIFVLGAACGALVMRIVCKSRMEMILRGDRKTLEDMLLTRLSRKLDLDDRQQEQVRSIVGKSHQEIDTIKEKFHPQMEAVMANSRAEMSRILKPDQRQKFEQFILKHNARHN